MTRREKRRMPKGACERLCAAKLVSHSNDVSLPPIMFGSLALLASAPIHEWESYWLTVMLQVIGQTWGGIRGERLGRSGQVWRGWG